MATLGTLVTMVSADVSGFQAGMATATQAAEAFERKVSSLKLGAVGGGGGGANLQGWLRGYSNETKTAVENTSRWGEELGHLGSRFTSLHGLLAIGLGVHLGRALFSELHEGIKDVVESVGELSSGEVSLGEALGDGFKKILGQKTLLEELTEAHHKAAESAKELADAQEKADTAKHGAPPKQFGSLPGGDEAESALHKTFTDADKAAKEQEQKLADMRGMMTPDLQQAAQHGGTPQEERMLRSYREAERVAKPSQDARDAAAIAYQREVDELTKDNQEQEEANRRQVDHNDEVEGAWNQRKAADKERDDAEKELTKILEQEAKDAAKRAEEISQSHARDMESALKHEEDLDKLRDSVRTPMEKYRDEMRDLESQHKNGLDDETYNRLKNKFGQELAGATGGRGGISGLEDVWNQLQTAAAGGDSVPKAVADAADKTTKNADTNTQKIIDNMNASNQFVMGAPQA